MQVGTATLEREIAAAVASLRGETVSMLSELSGEQVELEIGTGTTDARSFNLYGPIPATCCGPPGAAIHGIDEWVSIDSTMRCTKVPARFIARWCGMERAN